MNGGEVAGIQETSLLLIFKIAGRIVLVQGKMQILNLRIRSGTA